ncbi:TIGR01244 family protein [Novosphingobium marinum]|uniref:Uncharacterized protein (TIGR01244 family) n=1 Tax=Novosphingobium marinum TaxID=1514948 RepID=A0A7Y9XX31_9SPHN|nr:TIGR01244 family sulfur transferase [Novosphingobium marinum]NYH94678.1 uncharacterized protein (TIGR01244 family) [Novosphingobium marinum]GGC38244.1 TIGR01244 family protein [Novosphingobium marinum]
MFRKLSESVYASPQITVEDIERARELGVTTIVNNRPDGESDDQTPGEAIEKAANEAGMKYVAIPVTHSGFSDWQVKAMSDALANAEGPVLAYCRSGTRSTLLWSLAKASAGADVDDLKARAVAAGYDLTPVQPLLDMLSSGND